MWKEDTVREFSFIHSKWKGNFVVRNAKILPSWILIEINVVVPIVGKFTSTTTIIQATVTVRPTVGVDTLAIVEAPSKQTTMRDTFGMTNSSYQLGSHTARQLNAQLAP